jgi:hypothetical protein
MKNMSDKIGMKIVWSGRNTIELDLCRSFVGFSISRSSMPRIYPASSARVAGQSAERIELKVDIFALHA